MAKKKKEFTTKRYNDIKEILKSNKIESYELENYVLMKDMKFLRHTAKISMSDIDILELVNEDNKQTKFQELLGDLKK